MLQEFIVVELDDGTENQTDLSDGENGEFGQEAEENA